MYQLHYDNENLFHIEGIFYIFLQILVLIFIEKYYTLYFQCIFLRTQIRFYIGFFSPYVCFRPYPQSPPPLLGAYILNQKSKLPVNGEVETHKLGELGVVETKHGAVVSRPILVVVDSANTLAVTVRIAIYGRCNDWQLRDQIH